jgi:hypothetical protein
MFQELLPVIGKDYSCILLGIDPNILNNLTVKTNE